VPAAFPHGFGLSYTTFEIRQASCRALGDGTATLVVEVANTGDRDGGHVVQVYGSTSHGPYAGEQLLVGFAPVNVAARTSVSVAVDVSLRPLATWDAAIRRRVPPVPSDVELEVGAHAHDAGAVRLRLRDL
jgi:beta-glucosidase